MLAMLVSFVPSQVFADGENIYTISNGYLTYMFNADTGGFAIQTAEGNPRKVLDNDIPLLYSDDKSRSNGTSFLTVRIDGKDYIFGQDYGFFNISSQLGTPAVTEDGRLMTIPWTIKGVTVTLKVALSTDENQDITGNCGFSAEVTNNSGEAKNVSLRLMLDTALGNETDAPYLVADEDIRPTLTEKEFVGSEVPGQIRGVDSLSNPKKILYLITKGWNNGAEPNRLILGHWANLANTRYDCEPDKYCDFSNYSNKYKTPDSAAAVYWENNTLAGGQSFCGEMLYGVGNFTNDKSDVVGINITADKVRLENGAYKDGGLFDVTVEIDNTGDNAETLTQAMIVIDHDDTITLEEGGVNTVVDEIGNEVITKKYKFKALPQDEVTAASIYVSLTATLNGEHFETAGERSVILPSVSGNKAVVQMNKVNPEIVYTLGEKAVTITGEMSAFQALTASQGWELKLKHTKTDNTVTVPKKNISFIDETFENISFTVSDELYVGKYRMVFEFTDPDLISAFGNAIECKHEIEVSSDKKYAMKLYGIVSVVRSGSRYDVFTFKNEGEYLKFYNGGESKTGELNKIKIQHKFGENKEAIKDNEILLTVRANLREMERGEGESKEKYWQADFSEGDIIINNMLSYEGKKPIEISASNGNKQISVKGDGLLKVVNSINVWRSKWSFTLNEGVTYSLDTERMDKKCNVKASPVTLSLDGAATLIQSIAGFAVDLKFGEMSSEWHDGGDGTVTYGISFGGKMSIPISAKKKKTNDSEAILTADQEDIGDELNSLFDESLTADQEDLSMELGSMFEEPKKTTKTGDKVKMDSKLSEGQLAVAIDNIAYGENADVKDGKVVVSDTGFKGINATAELALPKDVLGSLVSNSPGVYASVTINTIDNVYKVAAGVSIKLIECEGLLEFKEVKGKVLPDKIEFYIKKGLKVPLAPPVLFMTGIGGGVNELAETIGGEFDSLPPITLLLYTRLEAIGTLDGEFNAKISLEGMSLKGKMKLKASDKLLDLEAGVSARWIEPWELNMYGTISIINGLIKGGVTINIADDYFYGYVFASICVPDSIPFVGGKELANVEAAVSNKFIGANVKILGIRFGVIYYWGDNVSFGKNIDLSAPAKTPGNSMALMSGNDVTGYYGTNVRQIRTVALKAGNTADKQAVIKVDSAIVKDQDALLLEIPYTGTGTPEPSDISIINKGGTLKNFVYDDGNGGGNFLVQHRDDGDFIYITIQDPKYIVDGNWTVAYSTENVEIESFALNGVDDITEVTSCSATVNGLKVDAQWTVKNGDGKTGDIDVYLTKDKDILDKIKTSNNNGDSLGINILHLTETRLESGKQTINLPDSFENGTYYPLTAVSSMEGISLSMGDTPVVINNPNLPKAVKSVTVTYGGNGSLCVAAEDADNADYTHYLAEIVACDGSELTNNFGQFEAGERFLIGAEAGLKPGKDYIVKIKTLREQYNTPKDSSEEYKKHYYYGTDTVESLPFTMKEMQLPVLSKVDADFDTSKEVINKSDIVLNYTFDNDVFMELDVNGRKAYSGGTFKKDWKFVLEDLDDGEYVIDFNAYTENKDHISGRNVPDGLVSFKIDTSAPVLSLTRQYADDSNGLFGGNVVFAGADGSYVIEGVTDTSATLTVDGATAGITRGANGTFKFSGKLSDGENVKTHEIKASDAAGNETSVTAAAVRRGALSYTALTLQKDGSDIIANDGEKRIVLKNGASFDLAALLTASSGNKITADWDDIEWSVSGEKNNIILKDGKVTAVAPGEAAVKARLNTAKVIKTVNNSDIEQNIGLADLAVIEITNNSKADLADKIAEAQRVLESVPDAPAQRRAPLEDEIKTARDILADAASTEEDYTNEVTALTNAISGFKNWKQPSTGSISGSGTIGGYVTITLLPTEHGTAALSHTKAVRGTSVTVTAVPDEGYAVSDILINGQSVGRSDTYTIKSVTENTTVQVIFGKKADLPFGDVLADDWFYETVKEAFDNKYMLGVSDDRFDPNGAVTRAMFVTILHRIEGEPDGEGKAFSDVVPGEYYEKAVKWASANGIVKGVSETEFAPDDMITREQMAAIIYRYAAFKGINTDTGFNLSRYSDFESVSDYAVQPLSWNVQNEIITGKTENTINPSDNATRAEAATVLMRFVKKFR